MRLMPPPYTTLTEMTGFGHVEGGQGGVRCSKCTNRLHLPAHKRLVIKAEIHGFSSENGGMDAVTEPTSPLLIGGMGGSGTRVYRAIAEAAGYRMLVAPWVRRIRSDNLHDNLPMAKYFYNRWIDRYLKKELSDSELKMMRASCKAWLWLCGPLMYNRNLWGWKNPRTILLIPFFNQMYPAMRFIHVIRDGRDHAFHPRFPYVAHQGCLLSGVEIQLPDPQRKGLVWSRVNQIAEAYAREHLQDRYIQSTLEKLCSDPVGEVTRILAFLGTSDREVAERTARLVKTPSSLGRWRSQSLDQIAAVEKLISVDLVRYGYERVSIPSHESLH
jgi:hypothetical protein